MAVVWAANKGSPGEGSEAEMAGERESGSSTSSSLVLGVLVALALANVVGPMPYSGSRPDFVEKTAADHRAVQDVEARLWQDPFAAVARHRDEHPEALGLGPEGPVESAIHTHTVDGLRTSIGTRSGSFLVMPLLVFGGRHADEIEARRRVRYAVVAGLGASGFNPEDPEHIGYVEGPIGRSGPDFVAYEWFTRVGHPTASNNAVLLVWVDERWLLVPPNTTEQWQSQAQPLQQLVALLSVLSLCEPTTGGVPHIAIVGPQTSDLLVALSREISPLGRSGSRCVSAAAMYSSSATVELTDLPPLLDARTGGMRFFRFVPTDRAIVPELIEELRRRDVDLRRRSDHIALIAEWDTEYGRQLAKTITNEPLVCGPTVSCRERVHVYSYLRGLDGVVPEGRPRRERLSRGESAADQEKSNARATAEALERADGPDQFDYLRRLATRIVRADEDLRRRGAGTFKAIGVVGTDVYDKLLVLQAVRRSFPRATFFSTDLDARFIHPQEFPWTRNLVVASGYGLQLREELQKQIPPFRDSYQTATFLATRAAIEHATRGFDAVKSDTIDKWMKEPRVFEIGRTQPVDLSSTDPAAGPCVLADCASVHPPRAFFFLPPWWKALSAVVALATLAVIVAASSYAVRQAIGAAVPALARDIRAWLAAIGLTAAVAAAAVVTAREGAEGEPFSVFEGVSMWPTEIIRAVAVTCSVIFIAVAWSRLHTLYDSLHEEYFPETPAPSDRPSWRDLRSPRAVKTVIVTSFVSLSSPPSGKPGATTPVAAEPPHRKEPANPSVDAETLWLEHLYQASTVTTVVRVMTWCAVFFVLGIALNGLFGFPNRPHRGRAIVAIDIALLFGACIPAALVLLFLVLDAVRLCNRFARRLTDDRQTAWQDTVRKRLAEKLGVDENWAPVSYLLDVNVIAAWTKGIKGLVYLPFIVIGMLFVSRASFFDNWDLPVGLLIIFLLVVAIAVAACLILRSTAERIRTEALTVLGRWLIRETGATGESVSRAGQLRLVIEDIRSLRGGAFAPLMQQPVIKALLLPLSGAGGIAILEYFVLGR
jgi:hypothetical protein